MMASRRPLPVAPGMILVLIVIASAAAWFVSSALHYVTDFSAESYSPRYWPRRWALLAHVSGGMVATGVGLVQLWLGLTGRTSGAHRILGRVYVGAIGVGVVGALALTLASPHSLALFGFTSGLVMLNIAWIATTAIAVWAIRARKVALHREWMIRSYAVTFGFVAFRLFNNWLGGMIDTSGDGVGAQIDAISAWASWSVPLLIVEVGLAVAALRKRQPATRSAADLG